MHMAIAIIGGGPLGQPLDPNDILKGRGSWYPQYNGPINPMWPKFMQPNNSTQNSWFPPINFISSSLPVGHDNNHIHVRPYRTQRSWNKHFANVTM
jgi:hypothetical protein